MPQNAQAEIKLLENPLDSKKILASYTNKRTRKTGEELDDDDLKNAIKMSLIENDMDLDNKAGTSNIQYPSLAVEMQQDDDLKKAIELSLAMNAGTGAKEPVVLTSDELRDKRLKRFENVVKTVEANVLNEVDKKEEFDSKEVCQNEEKLTVQSSEE